MENIYQPEIEVTDPKILKARKQVFALGLSGLLVSGSSWLVCIIYTSFRMVMTALFEVEYTAIEFIMCFLVSLIVGMILGLIAMMKGKKLKKVGQLKGKSITGYVLGNISFWWVAVMLIPFIWLSVMILSGQIPIPGGV